MIKAWSEMDKGHEDTLNKKEAKKIVKMVFNELNSVEMIAEINFQSFEEDFDDLDPYIEGLEHEQVLELVWKTMSDVTIKIGVIECKKFVNNGHLFPYTEFNLLWHYAMKKKLLPKLQPSDFEKFKV